MQGSERQRLVGCDISQKSTNSSTNYMTCRTDHMDSQKSTIMTNISTNTLINTNTNRSNTSPRNAKHGYDELSTVRLTDNDVSAGGGNDSHQTQGLGLGLGSGLGQGLGQELEFSGSATESQKEKKRRILEDDDNG